MAHAMLTFHCFCFWSTTVKG